MIAANNPISFAGAMAANNWIVKSKNPKILSDIIWNKYTDMRKSDPVAANAWLQKNFLSKVSLNMKAKNIQEIIQIRDKLLKNGN